MVIAMVMTVDDVMDGDGDGDGDDDGDGGGGDNLGHAT